MDSLGEKTLETLLGFIALRLESNWRVTPINSARLENLQWIKKNRLEGAKKELELVR